MPLLIGPDPDYYSQMSQRWQSALEPLLRMKAAKKVQEQRDVEIGIELMTKNPELANTIGNDLVNKYGRQRPELVSLVSTLQNQGKMRQQSEAALSKWERAHAMEMGRREKFKADADAMPDSVMVPVGTMGQTAVIPNQMKQAALSQFSTLPDAAYSALAGLSDDDRYAALVAMRMNEIEPPQAPEGLGPKDLNEALRGLMASGYGMGSPEFQTTALGNAGYIEKPATRIDREEDYRINKEIDQREAEQLAAENARKLQEQLDEEARKAKEERAMVDYRAASERGMVDYREAHGGGKGDKASTVDAEIEEVLDSRLRASAQRTKADEKYAKDKKAYDQNKMLNPELKDTEPSPPPPPISLTVRNAIKEMVKQSLKDRPGDADMRTQKVLAAYDQLAAKSDSSTALNKLRQFLAESRPE